MLKAFRYSFPILILMAWPGLAWPGLAGAGSGAGVGC